MKKNKQTGTTGVPTEEELKWVAESAGRPNCLEKRGKRSRKGRK
jgi:hypothetical protein